MSADLVSGVTRARRRLVRVSSVVIGAMIVAAAFAVDALEGAEAGVGAAQVVFIGVGAAVCASCLLPVRSNQRALLVVAAAAVACGIAEVGLRVFTSWGNVTVFELHPRYLHRYVPHASKMFRRLRINGAQAIPVSINAHGFRGDPLVQPKSGLRVVVYGDSCIAAEFSPLEETFVARLGHHLADAFDRPVEAVNAGVPAYGPDQSLLRMQDELPWLDADLVVVSLFAGNDLGDLLRNKLFRLGERGELRENPHSISTELAAEFGRARFGSALGRLVAGEASYEVGLPDVASSQAIALEEARMLFWLDQCLTQYADTVLERNPRIMSPLNDYYDADVALHPTSEWARYKVRLMDAVVGEIARVARRAGVPILVLVIPSPIDVCDGLHLGRVDRSRFPRYAPARLTRTLSDLALRNGVPHVDLYQPFKEHEDGADALHFRYGNSHWNGAGQDLAARLTAEYVVAARVLR